VPRAGSGLQALGRAGGQPSLTPSLTPARGAAPLFPRRQAAATPNSLHVVYINTSLLTKATANELVPTITCTSSNVVQTILQAFAQVRRRYLLSVRVPGHTFVNPNAHKRTQ
jgi:hypothetical protein